MDQNNQLLYECPICGIKFSLANGNVCPNCHNTIIGAQISQSHSNNITQPTTNVQNTINNVQPMYNNANAQSGIGMPQPIVEQPAMNSNIPETATKEKTSTSSIVFLVLSLINFFIIRKWVLTFLVVFALFGALGTSTVGYYTTIYGGFGYIAASTVAPIVFIINIIMKGHILKKCLLVICVSFIIGAIALPGYYKASKATNLSPEKVKIGKNVLTNGKVVYDENGVKIIQDKIEYNYDSVIVSFNVDIQDSNKNNINLGSYAEIWVNNCHISSINVEKDNNKYSMIIKYSQLSDYDINNINTIDFIPVINSKNTRVTMTLEGKEDNTVSRKVSNTELIYSNEYFKMYLDKEFEYRGKLYIEGLVNNTYELQFSKADLDTHGYVNSGYGGYIYNHSFNTFDFYFHPCEYNFSYMKFDYSLRDNDYNEIKKEHVELKFDSPKLDKRYCQAKD